MKPIGPLMREHRLIERMANILEKELMNVKDSGSVDTTIVSKAVDFFRTYADRTHHGKEEDILFKQLSEKNLTLEHKKMMNKLIADHAYARKTVGALKNANASVAKGNNSSTQEVISNIEKLIELYPRHISIEDKEFFYPILEYFSKEEQDDILEEFRKFDRKMIHEKYTKIVDDLEQ